MPRGNPAIKLAISMDPDVHARVARAAEAEGSNISAWLTAAARQVLRVQAGLAAVAEWEAEQGPLTPAELEAARRRIGGRAAAAPSLKGPVKLPPARRSGKAARKKAS